MNEPVRERILDAAVSVLAEVGRPTTKLLTSVAERAGVSRPTIYRHVGSQTDLFEALIRREVERRAAADILPALGRLENPYEDLAKTLEVMIRMVADHPVVKFVIRESPGTVVRQMDNFAPILAEAVVPIVQPVFDEAISAGRIPAVDVTTLVLWGARIAASREAIPVAGNTGDIRTEVEQLLALAALLRSPSKP
ncbi:TetR/AcrR family transcriptional regulator [Nocardioides baekrokdamisoli]|nr:TetR/AcrR family transcriptional regulator [Nocardioides baekrokdamisoli]